MRDPADTNIDPEHARERPASGCIQVAITWLIVFVAVFVFYYLRNLLAEVASLTAGFIAAPPVLALVFYGGFSQAARLALPYVWIAWGAAALPVYAIIGYIAAMTGSGRNVGDAAVWMLLVFPALGALVMSSGVRFRQTRHWAFIVTPIMSSVMVVAWLYMFGF